jgi:hypothetical protein
MIFKHVMKEIISYKEKYVKWPTDQARKFVHKGFKTIGGIEDIIGTIDGTHLILQNAPQKDKEFILQGKKGMPYIAKE